VTQLWKVGAPLGESSWGILPQENFNKCSAVTEMGDRLSTIDMSRKLGGSAPYGEKSWIPMQHSVAWVEAYLHTKWRLDPSSRLATINMGRKLGAVPLFWGFLVGSWVPI